ncbi:hypothetical protein GQ44DRAFT_557859, partial [Phaeosphaeriaceae sp. PMI808]
SNTPAEAMSNYQRIVRQYSLRNVTNDGDILNAFTGVMNALESSLGSFHYGLPLSFFSRALCWTPETMERISLMTQTPITRRTGFPSWSWAGW